MPPNNPSDPDAIIRLMVQSLPKSDPTIKDAYAAIALFYHACMLSAGFRLVGLGEDHKIGKIHLHLLTIQSSDQPQS